MPVRLLSSSDWQNLKRYLGSLLSCEPLLCFFCFFINTFLAPASQLLLHFDIYRCVSVCAHMHSYTLQYYFAICWFCLTLNLHEVMISLEKPLEVSLCYKQPASLWTGFITPSSVICCLRSVGSTGTKPMLRKRSVTVEENSEFGQYLALP